MVTQKTNGGNNDITVARSLYLLDGIVNVRLEPGEWRASGLTLIGQTVVLPPQTLRGSGGGGGKLLGIGRSCRHGFRNGVRRVNECGALRPSRTERLACLVYRRGNRLNKPGMGMPGSHIRDLRSLTP